MRYALTLALPFYLSCAVPKVTEKSNPIIVEISPAAEGDLSENEPFLEEEGIPFKRVVGVVTERFSQLLRQQHQQTLEGTIYFDNSNQSFEYHYEPLPFCEADSGERYLGKITFEYASSQEMGKKKMITTTTLTDVAPFGSVDKIGLLVDGTVRIPFYADYKPNWKAQHLQEALFRRVYQVLERHAQHNATWEGFDIGAIVKDEKWQTYRLHHELFQVLLSQDPLFWDKIKMYNPCEL